MIDFIKGQNLEVLDNEELTSVAFSDSLLSLDFLIHAPYHIIWESILPSVNIRPLKGEKIRDSHNVF